MYTTTTRARRSPGAAVGEWIAIAFVGGLIGGVVGITILAAAAWFGVLQWIGELAR